MTDFRDVSIFDRHFNFHNKVGDPGDTEILVSGIERTFTNTLYAKIDSISSGINVAITGYVWSDGVEASGSLINNLLPYLSGETAQLEAQAGANTKTITDLIQTVILGQVWADGIEASGSLVNTLLPYLSGETAQLEAQAGANTKTITDRIDDVILGQVWKDGIEASGSLINDNVDATISSRVTQTSFDLFSGDLNANLTASFNIVNNNIDTVKGEVQTISGKMLLDIENQLYAISGEIGSLPNDLSSFATLTSIDQISGILINDITPKIEEISGLIGTLPNSLATIATLSATNQLSGMIGGLPNDLSTFATLASVDLLSGMLLFGVDTKLRILSGEIGILPTDLSLLATQISVNELSGLVGSLPNDFNDFATTIVQTSGMVITSIETKLQLLSGEVGILPTNYTVLKDELDLISGKLATIESMNGKTFRTTVFSEKFGASTPLGSGEYTNIFLDAAYADTKLIAFTIDDDGAVNKAMSIRQNPNPKLFPFGDRVAFIDNTEELFTESVQVQSGKQYAIDVYCEGAGTNATLASLKIIELL